MSFTLKTECWMHFSLVNPSNESALGNYFIDKFLNWQTLTTHGREPWSSGYEWQLMLERSWVQIPAPYTGWTFFTLFFLKICIVCFKRPKINENEAGVRPLNLPTYVLTDNVINNCDACELFVNNDSCLHWEFVYSCCKNVTMPVICESNSIGII